MRSSLTRTSRSDRTEQAHIPKKKRQESTQKTARIRTRGTCSRPYIRTKTTNPRTVSRILDVLRGDGLPMLSVSSVRCVREASKPPVIQQRPRMSQNEQAHAQ